MDIFELAKARILAGKGGTGGGGGGGSSVSPKDVNFYDYDGTLLHSYTVAEAQALSELPPLPTQKGLICQGWNWTLDDIKAENRAVDVGANYITDDGKTRLYISIPSEDLLDVPLVFYQENANRVILDWGDGSPTEKFGTSGNQSLVHTYAKTGDYVITFEPVGTGTSARPLFKLGGYTKCVIGGGDASSKANAYNNLLKKVELGKEQSKFQHSVFANCYCLSSITMPNNVTEFDYYTFYNCHSLSGIVVPNGIGTLGADVFYGCTSLDTVIVPKTVTRCDDSCFEGCYNLSKIRFNALTYNGARCFNSCHSLLGFAFAKQTLVSNYMFYGCCSLTSMVIPSTVTRVRDYAFADCGSMKYYDFTSHTAVPTLDSRYAFNNIPANCEIRVPAALYDTWKAATNWSNFADYIVAV